MIHLERKDLIVDAAWIDGRKVPHKKTSAHGAVDSPSFAVENPADGTIIANVADSTAAEAAAAAEAALRAFPPWRDLLAAERANHLKAWFQTVKSNAEDLARLISLEQGKPLTESRAEVAYGAAYIEWFAEQCRRSNGEILPPNAVGRKVLVLREPIGIVATITPWNFPLAMLARKVAPALAAGCTVVSKPAEDTPLTALALAMLATESGIPPGVFNVVPASREHTPAVVDEWLRDPRIRKLSFTGSTAVGKHLAERSAATLKRLSLELGGNAPFIVFEDADLDAAVTGAIASKFRNAGQTCVCANRILVQSAVYDEFAEKLVSAVEKLRVGPAGVTAKAHSHPEPEGCPTQSQPEPAGCPIHRSSTAMSGPQSQQEPQIGPLINHRALEKVERHLADAVAHGATILTGGHRHALGRYFFQPTVLSGANPQMALACEETFGPVAPLFRFDTESEAIALANSTPSGLAAYFYSQNYQRIWRVAAALEAGMIGINEGIISTETAPFGGIKESGYGREGSQHGMEDYQQLKYLCMAGLTPP